jgi:hypothetical protein
MRGRREEKEMKREVQRNMDENSSACDSCDSLSGSNRDPETLSFIYLELELTVDVWG